MDTAFTDRLLAWNNTAIANLMDGKTSDCIEILRYALSQFQCSLQNQSADHILKRRPPSHNKGQETEFQSIPLHTKFSTSEQGNGTFAFYNRMVVRDARAAEHTSSQLLCMLFFNMAVVHHQLGLAKGRSWELDTALQLYHLAFDMVEGSADDFLMGDQQLLLLGIYNNMGHIHSCFSRFDETRACVEWIQRVFLAFPKVTPTLEESDFHFYLQYMSVTPQKLGSAASAA